MKDISTGLLFLKVFNLDLLCFSGDFQLTSGDLQSLTGFNSPALLQAWGQQNPLTSAQIIGLNHPR